MLIYKGKLTFKMDNDTEKNQYFVKTSQFEGPFGLLLQLVEERKFFINDLSLSQVTEDYLKYVQEFGKSHPSEISSFIIVAATLLLIKSKSLLPNLNLTAEEESDIKNLEERLRLYEMYVKLSVNVKAKFGKKIIFPLEERKMKTLVFVADKQITTESMMNFARSALGRMPKKIILPEIEVKKVISIEEMIENLRERIQNSIKTNFKEFFGTAKTKEEKVNVIVGFLAMLELVREGILNVVQENNFEDIIIEKHKTEQVPSI